MIRYILKTIEAVTLEEHFALGADYKYSLTHSACLNTVNKWILHKKSTHYISITQQHRPILPSEITQFQHARLWVKQKVLWLDISMTDAETMNVCETTKQLVHIQLQTQTFTDISDILSIYRRPKQSLSQHQNDPTIELYVSMLWQYLLWLMLSHEACGL